MKFLASHHASLFWYRFEGEFYDGEHDVDKEDAYVEVLREHWSKGNVG